MLQFEVAHFFNFLTQPHPPPPLFFPKTDQIIIYKGKLAKSEYKASIVGGESSNQNTSENICLA